ncbi:MAG: NAD(P)/FAD-dependent oxidoreductase [Actinomycetota bacterium]
MSTRRILIVGGGFIGMYAARKLERLTRAGHTITLVNPENFMLYQPFLPEVASGTIDPRAVVVPLRQVLRTTRLLIGEVMRVDHAARSATIQMPDGSTHEEPYDILILGTGSRSRTLAVPGLAGHGIGFKTVTEAIYLRNRVLSALDTAAQTHDEDLRRELLTFVFVGGGYAGVEALAELEDLARGVLKLYPTLHPHDLRWVLVEAAERILPELGEDLADYARERLQARDIEVALGTRLESATGGRIVLSDGQRFRAHTLVWTAGVKPSPLPRRSGLPTDDAGRILADECLRVVGVTDAWAAGDVAAVPDRVTGTITPPTAQYALRQARRLAANVIASIEGGEPRPFTWRNLGGLCALGRYHGVAKVLGIKLRGFPAWFLHRSYHLAQMPTVGRKVRIMLDWTVALFFRRDIAQLGSLERPHEPFERASRE